MPASGLVRRDKPNGRVAPWGLWKGRNRVLRKKLGFVAIRRGISMGALSRALFTHLIARLIPAYSVSWRA